MSSRIFKTMVKNLIVLPFILITSSAISQQHSIDSLKHKFEITNVDTARVLLLSELASSYVFYKPDSAFYYTSEGLELARKINYANGEALNLFWLAVYFRFTGSPAQAMQLATKALSIFETCKNEEGAILSNQMIGWTAKDNQDYQRAIDYHFRAARRAEHHNNYKLYYSYGTIAELYLQVNKVDSALVFAEKALSVLNENNNYPLSVLGMVNERMNHDSLALVYYHKAVSQNLPANRIRAVELFSGIAKLFYKTGQIDSSSHYATKAYNIAVANNFLLNISETTKLLTAIYQKKNIGDSILKYMQITIDIKDSLFSQERVRNFQSLVFNEKFKQQEMETEQIQYRSRIRTYIYIIIIVFFFLLAILLFRNNKSKQRINAKLTKQKQEIENALADLKMTQNQLIQSEKMASLGELTAGIAHEIQNPLNFVNNFSEVSSELLDEMSQELKNGDIDEAKIIASDVKQNLAKINYHGKRADAIVKGMLQHSRSSSGVKEPTDINALADEYLRLAFHGHRAKDKSFNVNIETSFDVTIGSIRIVPQDIGRVILNLINNALYAVGEKKKMSAESYEPTITVTTKKSNDQVLITIKDNGNGIPQKVLDKVFQPFFTTKPTGQGTGLGLSLSYDIAKAHGGELNVETREGQGAEFVIRLPE